MFIPRVREEDGGRYECKGRSEFGPTSHPVVLVVGGKYTGIHSADRETDHRFELSWVTLFGRTLMLIYYPL